MTEEMAETIAETEPEGLEDFLNAYVEAALWSSTDNADDSGGEPLDGNYDESDIAPETLARMRADCAAFLNHRLGGRLIGIAERLEAEGKYHCPGRCGVTEYAGHDFFMTRNGAGVGFWEEGDWPKGMGKALDELAKGFGTFDLYVGDDGLIHGA